MRNGEQRGGADARPQNSASLVRILEDGVVAHSLAESKPLHAYTGFAKFSDLQAGGGFLPMNGNRAVDRAVVAGRVADNLRRLREGRPLADFGQIILVVVSEGPPDWLVMDGQHRLEAMRELHAKHNVDVHFQFRAKVVKDEAAAHEELLLYQDQHPPDPRSFLPDRRQTGLAEQVLAALRSEFPAPGLWPASDPSPKRRPGLRTGDPDRPLLTDNIVLGFLGSSGLLRDEAATKDDVMRRLLAADKVLHGRTDLGPGVSARMRKTAGSLECFLGFLRQDKLVYEDIRAAVDARLASMTPPPRRDVGTGLDPGVVDECQICLDAPRTHIFQPCGHRCACEACASRIAEGQRPHCPKCRAVITGTQRIYD